MKLWQTGTELHPLIEKFTVGDDCVLDQDLIPYDIQSSLAHAKMLQQQNILSESEFHKTEKGLNEILDLWKKNKFKISPNQEDGHTAIEEFLTENYGEIGQKIHTGRSRNDQAMTMMRLFMKDKLPSLQAKIQTLKSIIQKRSKETIDIPFPGYTHAQKAMPTTIGTWLESFLDGMEDQIPFFQSLEKLIDQSPLGSASGLGIRNFQNDQPLTANKMGFAKVQKNPLYCGLSRGLFEFQFLQTLSPIALILSRLNSDLILFSMQEFRFMSLPESMTTGSSIMPQKRNYDALELTRARINEFLQQTNQIQTLYQNLISGYHRDLQLSKKVFIDSLENFENILDIIVLVIENLKFNEKNIANAMTEELFVTENVYDLVNQGMPFREAYKKVKIEFLNKNA